MYRVFNVCTLGGIVFLISGIQCVVNTDSSTIPKLSSVRFLVTVNDTWADPPGCIETIATNFIPPDLPWTKSEDFKVGSCDHGRLNYTITSPGQNNNKYTVSLTFYSSVIEDAGPPTCDLSWNGTYLLPRKQVDDVNLLPSCFVQDSREGWRLTYYWFQALDWKFEDE